MIDVKIVCKDKKYMPEYATEFDGCMDLKIVIKNENLRNPRWFDNMNLPDTETTTFLFPNEKIILDTGVQLAIPNDYVMLMYPRSSTGIKLNCMLCNTTGVIDSGYRDSIKLALYNYGNTPIELKDGQRVGQFMIIPRPKINLILTQDNEEFRNGDRGGGIGSTGV